jgi:hypothetical protein
VAAPGIFACVVIKLTNISLHFMYKAPSGSVLQFVKAKLITDIRGIIQADELDYGAYTSPRHEF